MTALTAEQVKASYNAIRKFDLTVPQPDMFDIAFGNDNIAQDVKSGTPMTVNYKDKVQFYTSDGTAQTAITKSVASNKWSTIFNQEYGRFALHSNYNWGTGEKKDNTAAAQILNPTTRATASSYVNWLDVYVGENESLNIGFRKDSEDGQAFADNFTLQYSGVEKAPIEIYQSASKSKQTDFDRKVHETDETTEVTYNLRRIFNQGQWNAIVLPVSLTARQLKEAFGNDVKLSRLYGVNENRPTQLVFKLVDLTDDNAIALNAHDCYVIKPAVLNYHKDGETSISGNNDEHKYYSQQIGVYTMRVTCYYDRPASVPANTYIVENGNLYYLQSDYTNLYATYWSLEDVTGTTTKAFSIAFDDDETTVIRGMEAEAKADDGKMYNLNGQRVADNENANYLPKGIYITNGRKVVVK